ncbi:hypothetical protein RDV64_19925 [Acuticoccus sp. MNP-M23]|uniref:hypothetical protein n=1 Tax=Acuticoccus sp. MNP-M23 TaxID=3072793 RepID=UPI0028155F7E|nr:hypothetical protein [Acuticoccus sp. MNP-M23]WMS42307.1 hypothetical protein RDV64_19925 [Acuticoccus sp. MNP-M23]
MAQTLPIPAAPRDLRTEGSFAAALSEEMAASPLRAIEGGGSNTLNAPADRPARIAGRSRPGLRTTQAMPRSIVALPFDNPDDSAVEDNEPAAFKTGTWQPIRADRGLEPAAPMASRQAPVPSERLLLLRDIRRAWMGSAFKRVPHTLVITSVRLARVPGANAPSAENLLHRTNRALAEALRELGVLYTLTDTTNGMLMADKSVRQATKIAEAIEKAIGARVSDATSSPLIFAAGVAAIHRDDDPVAALCLAERCLAVAEREGQSAVIAESDPQMRRAAAGQRA